ncbi:hypothetical protein F2Q68_00043304 [Brassica cretica]|uniref:Uncharacterized protein n=1 Tax=Brassica cretica TaxID=69181 RepID=A0A8S9LJQ3_BRACR|nr:hypothetical protein F2Q68_00043304 [Brassica cretica]
MTERTPPEGVPVALRLGTSAELPIPEVIRDAPHKETRRPGRPPGKRTLQNSPRLIAGASSRIRRVTQNKPSPRRKQATEKMTGQKANTNAGTSRRKDKIVSEVASMSAAKEGEFLVVVLDERGCDVDSEQIAELLGDAGNSVSFPFVLTSPCFGLKLISYRGELSLQMKRLERTY